MKPNIVFFGEDLGDRFHMQMGEDRDHVDLLIVVGSSLKVQPVALIPFNLDPSVPQILINREQLPHYQADITLLGNCDDILVALSIAAGGELKDKIQAGMYTDNTLLLTLSLRNREAQHRLYARRPHSESRHSTDVRRRLQVAH